jgi:hypothetical protein
VGSLESSALWAVDRIRQRGARTGHGRAVSIKSVIKSKPWAGGFAVPADCATESAPVQWVRVAASNLISTEVAAKSGERVILIDHP